MDAGYDNNLLNFGQGSNTSDNDVEMALLSVCLRQEKAVIETVGKHLVKDDFADPRNGLIFDVITRLFLSDEKIDKFTVSDLLNKEGNIEKAGGFPYIYKVAEIPAVVSNVSGYIKIIRDNSDMRKLRRTLDDLKKKTESGKSASEIADAAIATITGLKSDNDNKGFESISDILKVNIEEISKELTGKNEDNKKVMTGFSKLDRMLGGLRPGSLNIIAARPGMGKSALAVNIATYAATLDIPVAIFSLEMSKTELGNRLINTGMSTYTVGKILHGHYSDERAMNDLNASIVKVGKLPLFIDDRSDVNPVTMKAKLTELTAKPESNVGLVIVDYLQLMTMPGRKEASRQTEVADISRSLKVLAKDFNIPIIALSQMSRTSAKSEDHTPQLTDLRDSGAIEQDADTVIFIDRPDYYNKGETKDPDEGDIKNATLYLSKNRHGEVGNVKVKWEPKRTRFFEEDTRREGADPEENGSMRPGQGSSFTRTVPAGQAASDYRFDDQDQKSSYDPDAYGHEPQEPDEEPDDLMDETNSDYPDGFFDD
ncbi:MAG: replicative DNA helicase [Clostridiales bacterium]|nr:replicative DNA helicase [Clostridiales bacterium]